MTYRIEKGVPLPPVNIKYPFAEMEVGDSFVVDADHPSAVRCEGSGTPRVGDAARKHGARYGMRFSYKCLPGGSVQIRRWE